MTVLTTSDQSFDQDVVNADKPVLVDFWAEWCGPCKTISPTLEEIAGELDGKMAVAKLDVDSNPGTPQKYGIRGLPTMMLFKNGQVAGTKVGACSKADLKAWVENSL